MGEDPDVDGGARIEAGIRILQQRGLVEQCFSLTAIESVIGALLERGPLVVGLDWRGSMNTPHVIDGWTVCRLEEEDGIKGVHAVLLNGIRRDLTLDGVTGFVRIKNSWTRTTWGDDGQVLLSFDDLATMMRDTGAFLPIPAVSVLQTGARQDVAIDGVPYGPRLMRYEQTAIGGDAWTRIDTVGAAAYAEAIARGIQHPETKPPLTIGIKGAWGAGKTSLMRMIRDRLERPLGDGSSDELRPIHLSDEAVKRVAVSKRDSGVTRARDLSRITNLALIRKVHAADPQAAATEAELQADLGAADDEHEPAADDLRDWRPTVWLTRGCTRPANRSGRVWRTRSSNR